jgi:hypothetical protein
MQLNSINPNTNLVEIINSASNVSGVKKINEADFTSDFKNFENSSSLNYKAVVLNEELNQSANSAVYSLKLNPQAPAAQISKANKTFLEAAKANYFQIDDTEDESTGSIGNYLPEKIENNKKGSGFYIVIGGRDNFPSTKLLKNFTSEFQKRINKTYHLGFEREPGTLVDLVF